MFTSLTQGHHTNHRHAKGGITPLRHDVALHDYMERQQKCRNSTLSTHGPALISFAISRLRSAGAIVQTAQLMLRRGQ